MTRRIVVRPRARAEIRHARDTYREISPQLEARFQTSVRERMARIGAGPEMYPKVHGEIRRTITGDFPYSVFYVVEPEAIVVMRVIHHARNPAEWPTSSEGSGPA